MRWRSYWDRAPSAPYRDDSYVFSAGDRISHFAAGTGPQAVAAGSVTVGDKRV